MTKQNIYTQKYEKKEERKKYDRNDDEKLKENYKFKSDVHLVEWNFSRPYLTRTCYALESELGIREPIRN